MSTASTSGIQAEVKRLTRALSQRPPEGRRRISLLRERARLRAELLDEEGEWVEVVDDEGEVLDD